MARPIREWIVHAADRTGDGHHRSLQNPMNAVGDRAWYPRVASLEAINTPDG